MSSGGDKTGHFTHLDLSCLVYTNDRNPHLHSFSFLELLDLLYSRRWCHRVDRQIPHTAALPCSCNASIFTLTNPYTMCSCVWLLQQTVISTLTHAQHTLESYDFNNEYSLACVKETYCLALLAAYLGCKGPEREGSACPTRNQSPEPTWSASQVGAMLLKTCR